MRQLPVAFVVSMSMHAATSGAVAGPASALYVLDVSTCPTCNQRFDHATFCPRDGARLVEDSAERVLGGRYRLVRKVGEGAIGEVYEAEHVYIRRRVAVKVLRPHVASDPDAIARLQREAESTSALGHPNIVGVLDFGDAGGGQVYLAMEWLEGENLDAFLERGLVDVETALAIAAQVCAGVAEAHEHGIIHRDLKPANLFMTRDRHGRIVVKVLDFGIAKLAAQHTQLTGTGVLVGTPNYMAPEQAVGEPVDARTDVYALGVILYEMLTGVVPFQADSPLAVLHLHTSRAPTSPSVVAPIRGIPRSVEAIVMRCLAKRPDDRFATMHELGAAIAAVQGGAAGDPLFEVPPPRHDARAGSSGAPLFPLPPRGEARRSAPPPATIEDDRDDVPAGGRRRVWTIAILASVVGAGAIGGIVLLARRGSGTTPVRPDGVAAVADGAPASADGPTIAEPIRDAATVGWVHSERGRRLALVASTDRARPVVGTRFDLGFAIELDDATRAAAEQGALNARVEVLFFRGHTVVHDSVRTVPASGRLAVPLTLERAGKHHVHLSVLVGGHEYDRVTFDIFAEP